MMQIDYIPYDVNKQIAYCYELAKGSNVAIIILHGLAEHKGRYFELMHRLQTADISSFAFDLRGHGESSGKRGDIDKFQSYIDDLSRLLNHIKEKFNINYFILFGHSLGGQIVASFTNTGFMTDDIVAVVLTSPAIAFNRLSKLIKLVPYRLFGNIKIKKRHSESRAMLAFSRNDPLSCKYFTLRLLGTMFEEGRKKAINGLYNIKIPTLIACGECDPLIKSNDLLKTIKNVNNDNIKLKVYDNVKHRIVQNEGCMSRIQDIIDWINGILSTNGELR